LFSMTLLPVGSTATADPSPGKVAVKRERRVSVYEEAPGFRLGPRGRSEEAWRTTVAVKKHVTWSAKQVEELDDRLCLYDWAERQTIRRDRDLVLAHSLHRTVGRCRLTLSNRLELST